MRINFLEAIFEVKFEAIFFIIITYRMYEQQTHDLILRSYPAVSGYIQKREIDTTFCFDVENNKLKYFNNSTATSGELGDFYHVFVDYSMKLPIPFDEYKENGNHIVIYIQYLTKYVNYYTLSSHLSEEESRKLFNNLKLNESVMLMSELCFIILDERITSIRVLYKNNVLHLNSENIIEIDNICRENGDRDIRKQKILEYIMDTFGPYTKCAIK